MTDEQIWSETKTAHANFTRGYDRGNYAAAYESQDWDSWYAKHCTDDDMASPEYREGCLLGFYSSFDLDEIADARLRDAVRELREKWDPED